jgi:hypothetical protein
MKEVFSKTRIGCLTALAALGLPASAVDIVIPKIKPAEEELDPIRHRGLRLSIFDVAVNIAASAIYDDNIYISGRKPAGDLTISFTPGFNASTGGPDEKSLALAYTPNFVFFVEQGKNNSIEHAASLAARWPMAKLTLGMGESFQSTSGSVTDVGNRVNQQSYSTTLTSHYAWTEKTSFEINGTYNIHDYKNLIGSEDWSDANWINYQIKPKLSLSLGLTLGYNNVQRQPSQTYEESSVRATYIVTGKISVNGSIGGQWRQFGGGVPQQFGMIFGLGASYLPRDGTFFTLESHRRNDNSAVLAGQNYTTTGLNVSVRQRVFDKLFVILAGGIDQADYTATTTRVVATRKDTYYTGRLGLDYRVSDRWQAGVFYQYRRNNSTGPFGFDDNQFGVQGSYSF